MRRLESSVTGMVIDHVAAEAHFSGPQLIFSQIAGQTSGGGSDLRQWHGHLLRRQDAAQSRLQREPGTAPQSRRCRSAGHRTTSDQLRRERRHDCRRPQAQQGPLPARPGECRRCGPAAQCARNGARRRGRNPADRAPSTGSSTSSLPGATSRSSALASTAGGAPISRSAGLPTRRVSPARPTLCKAITILPGVSFGLIAA